MSRQWFFMAIFCTSLVLSVETTFLDDKIQRLPGQPEVPFQQFAGYITVDHEQDRALFYYLVEAETEPASKPLVLWLNGGPGCSSLGIGAFFAHGPFKPMDGLKLAKNDYSWNKEANMLYVESPAGVGFSYSKNQSFYDYVDDKMAAADNLKFLQGWFAKFPHYRNADLFLAGENYAGHYQPQLAHLILKSGLDFKPKGIAIGNPFLEFSTDFNAEDQYMWSHAVISDHSYELLTSLCNSSRLISQGIRGGPLSDVCSGVNDAVTKELSFFLPSFNIQGDICVPSNQSQAQILSRFGVAANDQNKGACLPLRIGQYLNRKSVRRALHARLVGATKWSTCSSLQYDFLNLENSMIGLVGSLVQSGVRVMVYSGDQDSIVPFVGTRTLINRLAKELRLNTTVPYSAWLVGKQVAGWTQTYGGNVLSFAVVRGGGNSAAATEPERSLVLFKGFLEGKPLPVS